MWFSNLLSFVPTLDERISTLSLGLKERSRAGFSKKRGGGGGREVEVEVESEGSVEGRFFFPGGAGVSARRLQIV